MKFNTNRRMIMKASAKKPK